MSREEPVVCSSPDPIAPPTAPVSVASSLPGSSRASSSSSLRRTGFANGSMDRLTDGQPPFTSSSLSSLPRSSSDVMPQTSSLDGSSTTSADGGSGTSTPDVDPQIIEALKSKDRLFVLKLGEQMETLIRENNSMSKVSVSPENQYQRLLVHRCAQYYKLLPENDSTPRDKSGARDMIVSITSESRIPLRRIFELVPAEQTNHPTFKIMRRSELDRRKQKSTVSRPGSTAGEDAELSDPGPSEPGSMGSRSTTSKKRMTIQEREAEYEKARTRIFMDFEEKEKAKERDTSASSSTLSLASASGSGSQSGGAGGSSVSDVDDNASTAPTESEWSVPATDRRRGRDSGFSSAESSRSFPPYNVQTVANDRASGTSSPAFTFPSLYEPATHTQGYDQPGYMPPPGGYVPAPYPVYYAQPPPNASPMPAGSPPYCPPYPFFPQYQYVGPSAPPPNSNSSQPSPVSGQVEGYTHTHQPGSVPYLGPTPYPWMPPPAPTGHQQQHPPSESRPSPAPGQHLVQSPPLQGPPIPYAYPPYMPPPGGIPYPGYQPYFQPPPQAQPPIVHSHSQPTYPVELPPANGNGSDRGTPSGFSSGKGSPSPTLSRHTSSSGSSTGYQNHINGNMVNKRGPPATRGAWMHSPGLGMHPQLSSPAMQGSPGGGETVGPRLSSAMRRTSGASSNSSGYRTPGEETASVASSSTSSSSSRRTYNMTTPPKHPLPPRPDWAAGLKAQPTLHPPNRHRHDSNNSNRMSPARPPSQLPHSHQQTPPQQRPPIHLQPTDFPPLSSLSTALPDKRPPAAGVWSNTGSAARAVLSPNPGHSNQVQTNAYGTALFSHGNINRLEDDEGGFERPPPKNNAELFNPKGGAKRVSQSQSPPQMGGRDGTQGSVENRSEKGQARGEAVASAILIDKMASLKVQEQHAGGEIENTPRAESLLSRPPRDPAAQNIDGCGEMGNGANGEPSNS